MTISKLQRCALVIYVCEVVAAMLFPPYETTLSSGSGAQHYNFGYHFLFTPPGPQGQLYFGSVDAGVLLVELLAATLVVVAMFILLRRD